MTILIYWVGWWWWWGAEGTERLRESEKVRGREIVGRGVGEIVRRGEGERDERGEMKGRDR